MACGMPLPWVPGMKRRAIQVIALAWYRCLSLPGEFVVRWSVRVGLRYV